jgi:hypothetical protein
MKPKDKTYPIRIKLDQPKRKKPAENRPAGDPMEAVDRANRSQAMEAKEMKTMDMKKKPMKKYAKGGMAGPPVMETPAGKSGMMRPAGGAAARPGGGMGRTRMMAKGGKACGGKMKKYAKGGSIDGCAKKGKTKA